MNNSLLSEAMQECQMLDRTTVDDGYGGYVASWQEGARFSAAIVKDESLAAQVALSEGVTAVYTVTTGRNFKLDFHDVFKRLSDGKTFRVKTSAGDSVGTETPKSSALNMRQVKAEEWSVVNG